MSESEIVLVVPAEEMTEDDFNRHVELRHAAEIYRIYSKPGKGRNNTEWWIRKHDQWHAQGNKDRQHIHEEDVMEPSLEECDEQIDEMIAVSEEVVAELRSVVEAGHGNN